MAEVTRKGNSMAFSAVTDTYAGKLVCIAGITFQGTGLTAGQIVNLTDDAGDPIVNYAIEATIDSADLWNGRPPDKFYMGLKMNGTVAGSWALVVYLA